MEDEERIRELEVANAQHAEQIKNLQGWQQKQNGNLSRIDERLHSLERMIMATLAAALSSVVINLLSKK